MLIILNRGIYQCQAKKKEKVDEKGHNGMRKCNNVKKIREDRLISKMELARLAGLSSVTIGRIEDGGICRMVTKRKIILALGYSLVDKEMVFPD